MYSFRQRATLTGSDLHIPSEVRPPKTHLKAARHNNFLQVGFLVHRCSISRYIKNLLSRNKIMNMGKARSDAVKDFKYGWQRLTPKLSLKLNKEVKESIGLAAASVVSK